MNLKKCPKNAPKKTNFLTANPIHFCCPESKQPVTINLPKWPGCNQPGLGGIRGPSKDPPLKSPWLEGQAQKTGHGQSAVLDLRRLGVVSGELQGVETRVGPVRGALVPVEASVAAPVLSGGSDGHEDEAQLDAIHRVGKQPPKKQSKALHCNTICSREPLGFLSFF